MATSSQSLQTRIPMGLIIWRCVGRHPKTLTGPGAQVDLFAPLAAKRPVQILRAVDAVTATSRAGHDFLALAFALQFGWLFHVHRSTRQEQSVKSKAVSALSKCNRASSPWRIKRIDTISRLPLISGISPSAGSSANRSS